MLGKRIRMTVAGLTTGVLLAAAPGLAAAKDNGNNGDDNPGNKVTICHATSSQTNPYVQIKVNANGSVSGHSGHSNDIIPPFTYNDNGSNKNFPGLNWTTHGQAIYNNNCVDPGGGQGGGGGSQTINNTVNNLSTNVTTTSGTPAGPAALGAAAPQVQTVPRGGVAAGEGGAKVYQPAALMGLFGSLGSLASGVILFKRFQVG